MANVAGLKRSGKGEPPARKEAPQNIANPPRDKVVEPEVSPAAAATPKAASGSAKEAVQVKTSTEIANEFGQAAFERHGYKKGSKSKFFEELVLAYSRGNVKLD